MIEQKYWMINPVSALEPGVYVSGNDRYSFLHFNTNIPNQIGTLTNWSLVSRTSNSASFIKTDGTLWSTGTNTYGQLGLGDTISRLSPTQVGTDTDWALLPLASSGFSIFAIKTDGTLWAWGANLSGNLGLNDLVSRSVPTQVGTLTNWAQVANTSISFFGIKTDGTLWTCGTNTNGSLGMNNATNYSSPVQVGTLTNWSKIICSNEYSVYAIKTDKTLWAWGTNSDTQLGDGTSTVRSSPVQIGTATNWEKISAENGNAAGIQSDGTIWSWGANSVGQLGHGDTVARSVPTQIGNLTNWSDLSSVQNGYICIKTNGSLWEWGQGNNGQLGNYTFGAYADISSPVQLGSDTNWNYIEAGGTSVYAKKTDGSLYSWGYDYGSGVLGLNDPQVYTTFLKGHSITNSNINSIIASRTTISTASIAFIDDDKKIWSYGSNSAFELGNGSQISKFSPIQVGTDTNWEKIIPGNTKFHAIKTDGTLWAWGSNANGSMGINSATMNFSVPTQIGNLTDWSTKICARRLGNHAIKTDGTLWGWGLNTNGRLGNGSTENVIVPVQLPAFDEVAMNLTNNVIGLKK